MLCIDLFDPVMDAQILYIKCLLVSVNVSLLPILSKSLDDEEEEEFPNEPLPSRPVLDWSCYVCGNKKSARVAQKCYSPSCLANRKYSEEEERKVSYFVKAEDSQSFYENSEV